MTNFDPKTVREALWSAPRPRGAFCQSGIRQRVHSGAGTRRTPQTTGMRALKNSAAFTLAEVMIAATIGSFIMAAIVTTYIFSLKGFRAIENYQEIHSDGRLAIDFFSRDMRAAYDITSFSASNIVVKIPTAFSNQGTVTADKTVTYAVSAGTLRRTDTATGKTSVLANNINQLTFALYDRVGSNTTVLANAKGVQVDIKLRKTVMSQVQTEDYLSGRIEMRNKR
jgi:Tfp pilus assembly protein PilW